ncbi:MAG TPA: SMC family ATPase, partial [Dehalococcoidia bacterium]|nr:SMC family ATPase [Dehalococcoidia bacterium]
SALAKAREGALAGLQETQRQREEKRGRLAEGEDRARQAAAEMDELAGQEKSLLGRIQEHREVLAQKKAVSQALEEHRGLAEASERLGRAFQELYRLRQEENRLERTLELARSQLASEELLARREVAQLREAAGARQSLQETVRRAEEELAGLAPQLEEASRQRERLTAVAQELGVLQHTNQQIVLGGQELRAKVEQLNRPGATGVCPLCGSQLGPEGHRRIVEEYQAELERQRELYRANEQQIRTLQTEQERGQAALKALEESIVQQRTAAQTRAATAGRQLAEAERAAQDMVQLLERLTGLQDNLAREVFAPEERAALATTRKSIAGLGYDQEQHQAIQARLRELEPFVSASQRLQEAERQLPREEADLAKLQEAAARWRARLSDEADRTASLERELAALPDVVQELSRAHRELEGARGQLTAASTRLGGVQAQLEHCEALERVLRGQRAEAAQREQEKGIYDELTLAFGRRGLQALLIESALPELEQEANLLLGRMTDNRMHLALETQRQTRSGAIAETLDIKIADELGTRAYELYSGGEAFRINFALRIAISKLLARRAGAPLPTLMVDEGFGTQDTAGREKLIEAVNAIADDFERILVITHIDELKDAFPVRIEVTKTPEGSRVDVR